MAIYIRLKSWIKKIHNNLVKKLIKIEKKYFMMLRNNIIKELCKEKLLTQLKNLL